MGITNRTLRIGGKEGVMHLFNRNEGYDTKVLRF
jgi:hypothetical protein